MKSMLLPNFTLDVIYTGNKKNHKNSILLMFKQVLFNDFESMLQQNVNLKKYFYDIR